MKILVAAPIHKEAIEKLEKEGFEVVYREYPSEEELAELVKDVDAIIVRSKPVVSKKVINAANKLKVIGRAGVGIDNIDVETAKAKGIEVVNTPGAPTRSVAELTIALMLDVLRKISYSDRKMREGDWPKKEAMGHELYGKTLGIIGMGRIGREVAKIAYYGFGMRILYYDIVRCEREFEEKLNLRFVDLETLLKESDIVTIHVPLIKETYHLIDESKLRLMKKNAILINTARGAVVDTNALIKALREGWIAGAGLDVYEEEPLPPDHPLRKLENVVLTPHIGANTWEAQERAGLQVVEKIISILKNKAK